MTVFVINSQLHLSGRDYTPSAVPLGHSWAYLIVTINGLCESLDDRLHYPVPQDKIHDRNENMAVIWRDMCMHFDVFQ